MLGPIDPKDCLTQSDSGWSVYGGSAFFATAGQVILPIDSGMPYGDAPRPRLEIGVRNARRKGPRLFPASLSQRRAFGIDEAMAEGYHRLKFDAAQSQAKPLLAEESHGQAPSVSRCSLDSWC